jgi:hypothetical protein
LALVKTAVDAHMAGVDFFIVRLLFQALERRTGSPFNVVV